jgi:uncharacterized protein (DUF433 family)
VYVKTNIMLRDTGIAVTQIFNLIAQGYSYGQILDDNPKLIMSDIMAAADLARQIIEALKDDQDRIEIHQEIRFAFSRGQFVTMARLREKHARAFLPWTPREDERLAEMYQRGLRISDIAQRHQRQPGAIHARLVRLNLLKEPGQPGRD